MKSEAGVIFSMSMVKITRLIVIIAIVFVTMSCERLVRGPKPTNCNPPTVKSRNNHYQWL